MVQRGAFHIRDRRAGRRLSAAGPLSEPTDETPDTKLTGIESVEFATYYDSAAVTLKTRHRWAWILALHALVVSPWVMASAALGPHVLADCPTATHESANPCPGCPQAQCATVDCLSSCGVSAVAAPLPRVIYQVDHPRAPLLLVPPLRARNPPPVKPPPIV